MILYFLNETKAYLHYLFILETECRMLSNFFSQKIVSFKIDMFCSITHFAEVELFTSSSFHKGIIYLQKINGALY